MTKNTTVWKPVGGQGDVTNENDGDFLKIDATSYLLLSGTDRLLLGASREIPKSQTVWEEA